MTASEEQLANGGAVGNETGSEAADMQLIAEHTNGHPVEEPQSSSSSDSGAGGEERLVLRVILEVDDGVNQPMQSTQPSAQEELETLRQEAAAADYAARSAQYERDLLAHQFKAIAAEQSRMAAQLRAITADHERALSTAMMAQEEVTRLQERLAQVTAEHAAAEAQLAASRMQHTVLLQRLQAAQQGHGERSHRSRAAPPAAAQLPPLAPVDSVGPVAGSAFLGPIPPGVAQEVQMTGAPSGFTAMTVNSGIDVEDDDVNSSALLSPLPSVTADLAGTLAQAGPAPRSGQQGPPTQPRQASAAGDEGADDSGSDDDSDLMVGLFPERPAPPPRISADAPLQAQQSVPSEGGAAGASAAAGKPEGRAGPSTPPPSPLVESPGRTEPSVATTAPAVAAQQLETMASADQTSTAAASQVAADQVEDKVPTAPPSPPSIQQQLMGLSTCSRRTTRGPTTSTGGAPLSPSLSRKSDMEGMSPRSPGLGTRRLTTINSMPQHAILSAMDDLPSFASGGGAGVPAPSVGALGLRSPRRTISTAAVLAGGTGLEHLLRQQQSVSSAGGDVFQRNSGGGSITPTGSAGGGSTSRATLSPRVTSAGQQPPLPGALLSGATGQLGPGAAPEEPPLPDLPPGPVLPRPLLPRAPKPGMLSAAPLAALSGQQLHPSTGLPTAGASAPAAYIPAGTGVRPAVTVLPPQRSTFTSGAATPKTTVLAAMDAMPSMALLPVEQGSGAVTPGGGLPSSVVLAAAMRHVAATGLSTAGELSPTSTDGRLSAWAAGERPTGESAGQTRGASAIGTPRSYSMASGIRTAGHLTPPGRSLNRQITVPGSVMSSVAQTPRRSEAGLGGLPGTISGVPDVVPVIAPSGDVTPMTRQTLMLMHGASAPGAVTHALIGAAAAAAERGTAAVPPALHRVLNTRLQENLHLLQSLEEITHARRAQLDAATGEDEEEEDSTFNTSFSTQQPPGLPLPPLTGRASEGQSGGGYDAAHAIPAGGPSTAGAATTTLGGGSSLSPDSSVKMSLLQEEADRAKAEALRVAGERDALAREHGNLAAELDRLKQLLYQGWQQAQATTAKATSDLVDQGASSGAAGYPAIASYPAGPVTAAIEQGPDLSNMMERAPSMRTACRDLLQDILGPAGGSSDLSSGPPSGMLPDQYVPLMADHSQAQHDQQQQQQFEQGTHQEHHWVPPQHWHHTMLQSVPEGQEQIGEGPASASTLGDLTPPAAPSPPPGDEHQQLLEVGHNRQRRAADPPTATAAAAAAAETAQWAKGLLRGTGPGSLPAPPPHLVHLLSNSAGVDSPVLLHRPAVRGTPRGPSAPVAVNAPVSAASGPLSPSAAARAAGALSQPVSASAAVPAAASASPSFLVPPGSPLRPQGGTLHPGTLPGGDTADVETPTHTVPASLQSIGGGVEAGGVGGGYSNLVMGPGSQEGFLLQQPGTATDVGFSFPPPSPPLPQQQAQPPPAGGYEYPQQATASVLGVPPASPRAVARGPGDGSPHGVATSPPTPHYLLPGEHAGTPAAGNTLAKPAATPASPTDMTAPNSGLFSGGGTTASSSTGGMYPQVALGGSGSAGAPTPTWPPQPPAGAPPRAAGTNAASSYPQVLAGTAALDGASVAVPQPSSLSRHPAPAAPPAGPARHAPRGHPLLKVHTYTHSTSFSDLPNVEASRAQGGDASSASSSASSSIRGSNLGAPPTAGSTQATGASGASGHMHQVALKERFELMGVSPSRMPSGVGTEWLPWGFPSSPSMDLGSAGAGAGGSAPSQLATSPGARPAPAGHGTHVGAPAQQQLLPQPMTGAVGAVGGTHGGSNDTALLQAMLSDAISQMKAMTASIEEARATEAATKRDKQAIEERLAQLEAQVHMKKVD